MGPSPDAKKELGMSSKGDKYSNGMDIDTDDDDEVNRLNSILDLGDDFLKKFCLKASMFFFDNYGLISHQISSFNDFIDHGLQKVFDSFGEIIIEPSYDPSKKGDKDWRYASVRFGKVRLEKPCFSTGGENEQNINMLPRHARLQNMTYSSKMIVNVHLQVKKFVIFICQI